MYRLEQMTSMNSQKNHVESFFLSEQEKGELQDEYSGVVSIIESNSKKNLSQIISENIQITDGIKLIEQGTAIDTILLKFDTSTKKNFFLQLAQKLPILALQNSTKYESESYAKEVFEEAFDQDPFEIMRWVLENKNNPLVRSVLEIIIHKIPQYIEKEPLRSLEILKYLQKMIGEYFGALTYKLLQEDINKALARKDLKTMDYLWITEEINNLHEEKDEIRFMLISECDENKLYDLIIGRGSAMFTSTYNGIVDRLLTLVNKKGMNIYDLFKEKNFKGLITFIEIASSYGRLSDFLGKISNENCKNIIDNIFDEKNISGKTENEGSIYGGTENYIALMEMISHFKERDILDYIGLKIKENYELNIHKNDWGIIAKFVSSKFKDDPFFASLPDIYELPELKKIPTNTLFDSVGRNVQQYYFYNDDDGKDSFKNFQSTYSGKNGWKFQDKGSFVIVTSAQTKNKKQIIIYANKPEYDGSKEGEINGFDKIKQNIDGLKNPIESIIVVHRGHSFHAGKTIEQITPITKMVFLGSCGGFQNIGKIIEKSGVTQIIATKGTGSMSVNDPLFKAINEQALSGKDIIWEDIWKKITPALKNNQNFEKYIRPDQNIGVAYYKKKLELMTAHFNEK